METVYLETTVIGHLVGRILRDPVVAGRQIITRNWWADSENRFEKFISQLVIDECQQGDPDAAAERLAAIENLALLEANSVTDRLALTLVEAGAVPPSEPRDAYHIALAVVHGIKYLATWNFKHIANASMRTQIEAVCRDSGFEPPIICTPDELLGASNDP